MKNCGYCGRENEDSAVACRECGLSEFPETADEKARIAQAQATAEPELEIPTPDVTSDQEAAICPFCLFPNRTDRQWCKRCGTPFNASVVDPFQSMLAAGCMWRGLVRGRPKAIVLCLAWLWLFPTGVANVVGILGGLLSAQISFLSYSAIYGVIPFLILYKVTKNFLTIPKPKLDE